MVVSGCCTANIVVYGMIPIPEWDGEDDGLLITTYFFGSDPDPDPGAIT